MVLDYTKAHFCPCCLPLLYLLPQLLFSPDTHMAHSSTPSSLRSDVTSSVRHPSPSSLKPQHHFLHLDTHYPSPLLYFSPRAFQLPRDHLIYWCVSLMVSAPRRVAGIDGWSINPSGINTSMNRWINQAVGCTNLDFQGDVRAGDADLGGVNM